MDPSEEKIYNRLAEARTVVFRPTNRLLTSAHIKADNLTYFGLLIMIWFIFVANSNPVLAFWLLVARMLVDIMDGPLARFQGTASDRGKFVDVLADNASFALFVFGIIHAGLVSGISGAAFLYFTELVVLLMVIKYNLKHKSGWLFYASAGSFPYNFIYLSYLLFAVWALGGHNYLDSLVPIIAVVQALKAASVFWTLQKYRLPKN